MRVYVDENGKTDAIMITREDMREAFKSLKEYRDFLYTLIDAMVSTENAETGKAMKMFLKSELIKEDQNNG